MQRWGWSWVSPQLYDFIAPVSLMLGREDHEGQAACHFSTHSLMSPFEIVN